MGQIVGAQLSSQRVLGRGISATLRIGIALACASGALLAALSWVGVAYWASVILPMIMYMFATRFVLPRATAAALSPFAQTAGAASSLLGACQFSLGATASAGLSAAFAGTARPMATLVALGAAAELAAYGGFSHPHGVAHGKR